VRRSKALKPATVLAVNGLPRKFSAGQQRIPEAKSQNPPTLQAVYSGQDCLGFLLSRGKQGVEAFTAAEDSLGFFPDQKSAANAVSEAAAK
jgi:hypothetical protein